MAVRFQVTFDCADPARIANFWVEALGYRPAEPPEGFATWEEWLKKMGVPEAEWNDGSGITDPEGRGPHIYFQRVPESKITKNRVHLDLDISTGTSVPLEQRKGEVEAAASRLVGLGATRLMHFEQGDHYHVVMQDPEGNEFCLR